MPTFWIRTCQECFNKQTDKEPVGELTEAYRNRKCRRCKSEALDFGSEQNVKLTEKGVEPEDEE
jgi:hypothetical protein